MVLEFQRRPDISHDLAFVPSGAYRRCFRAVRQRLVDAGRPCGVGRRQN